MTALACGSRCINQQSVRTVIHQWLILWFMTVALSARWSDHMLSGRRDSVDLGMVSLTNLYVEIYASVQSFRPHYNDAILARWRLKLPAPRVFIQQFI